MSSTTDRARTNETLTEKRSPWTMLLEMSADLMRNPHGGHWFCSWNDGTGVHLHGDSAVTPEAAIESMYRVWIEAGSPTWRPYMPDEEQVQRAWADQRLRWLRDGAARDGELPRSHEVSE